MDTLKDDVALFVRLHNELLGSLCSTGKGLRSDTYPRCDDLVVNMLMDQYGYQISNDIIKVNISLRVKDPDFWFSPDQKMPSEDDYTFAISKDQYTIQSLINMGALEASDLDNPNIVRNALYKYHTSPCIYVEIKNPGYDVCINFPMDMLVNQPPLLQQSKMLYIAYTGLQMQEYINLNGENTSSQKRELFMDKASLFQGRFMHLAGVEKFEDTGSKLCVDKHLAANVNDSYFDFVR